jgi:3-dehydroquinate synthase
MARRVEVSLGSRSYAVHIGNGLLGEIGTLLAPENIGGRCAIISDSTVAPIYGGSAQKGLRESGIDAEILTVPAGENSKSMAVASDLCERLLALGLDRSAFIVALGGGVIGDLAGFVAAIYYRGIPYVQVPTTVLAQVDSSVGGKTGVNARGGKNLIGAFHQPRLVVADTATLRTLPAREYNEGFAEIIKHGAIRDRALLDVLDSGDLPAIIARNVEIKAEIVAADEHETTGLRALLNFGHTIGHAIENAAGYGRFLHGEAISLGLTAACNLSMRLAGLSRAARDLVVAKLSAFQLPTQLGPEITTSAVMTALRRDKKFAGGEVRFVLVPELGTALLSADVTLRDIEHAVEELRSPAQSVS